MPLVQTMYGGQCPLEKFTIDIPAGAGSYTADPVELCASCNFSDPSRSPKGFDIDAVCQCPEDMTWREYDALRKQFKGKTKPEFQAFVLSHRQNP